MKTTKQWRQFCEDRGISGGVFQLILDDYAELEAQLNLTRTDLTDKKRDMTNAGMRLMKLEGAVEQAILAEDMNCTSFWEKMKKLREVFDQDRRYTFIGVDVAVNPEMDESTVALVRDGEVKCVIKNVGEED